MCVVFLIRLVGNGISLPKLGFWEAICLRKVTGIHPEEFRTYSDKLLGDEEGYPNDDLRNKEIVVGGDMVGVEEFESVIYDFESPLSVQLKVKEFEKNLKELFERR